MDRTAKGIKKLTCFGNFDLDSGIDEALSLNLNDIFAMTDTTTYFLKMPIDSFIE